MATDQELYVLIKELSNKFETRDEPKGKTSKKLILESPTTIERPQLFKDVKNFLNKKNIKFEEKITSLSGFPVLIIYGEKEIKKLTLIFKPRLKISAAKTTSLQESSHCLLLAIREFKGKDITKEDITKENAEKVRNKINVTESIDNMLKFLNGNDNWMNSIILVSNSLIKKVGIGLIYHRGSQFVKQIENEFKKVKKNSKIVGLNPDINKWNPADIWLSKIKTFPKLDNKATLIDLNNLIEKLYNERKLIGISLKMVKNNVRIIEMKPIDNIHIECGGPLPDKVSPWNTKVVNCEFKGNKHGIIEMRNAIRYGSISGQILGSNARHGRVGLKAIEEIISHNLNKPIKIISLQKIKNMSFNDKYNYFKKLYLSVFKGYPEKKFDETYKIAINKKKKIDDDFFVSKIQGLEVANYVLKAPKNKSKNIIRDIITYAASLGVKGKFENSIYLKVF